MRQFLTTATEPIPYEVIQKLQDIQRRGAKLGTEDTLALLKIRLHQLQRAFICIDAFDELEKGVRHQLLNTLKELSTVPIILTYFSLHGIMLKVKFRNAPKSHIQSPFVPPNKILKCL